jgi:hypothetical protein
MSSVPNGPSGRRTVSVAVLRPLGSCDRAVYRSVARLSTPQLDEPLRRVSCIANFSKPWFITAGLLAVVGGPDSRRATLTGLAAIGAASLVVNQPMKLRRPRSCSGLSGHRLDRLLDRALTN